jgi:hypothetical protein
LSVQSKKLLRNFVDQAEEPRELGCVDLLDGMGIRGSRENAATHETNHLAGDNSGHRTPLCEFYQNGSRKRKSYPPVVGSFPGVVAIAGDGDRVGCPGTGDF